MNFFEHQDRARKQTGLLVFLFGIGVVLIIAMVNGVVLLYTFQGNGNSRQQSMSSDMLLWTTAITVAVILFGTLKGMIGLGNGAAIAKRLGGKQILPGPIDPGERRVMNVVEEMAIASGVTVPTVFVFEGEEINAFAAGNEPDTAVIAVSRGALRTLNREELQGVIAHEFSHIFNGDMRLNLRLIGVLNGILMIALIGRFLLRTRGKKNPLPLFGLVLMIVGYVGVFMSRIIKSAVSRQREFLADASAVQFTRNPSGMVGALAKIAKGSSFVDHPQAEQVSHLFFAQGFRTMFDGMFASHPPIIDRLHAIDPSFKLESFKPTKPSSTDNETGAVGFAPKSAAKSKPVEPAAVVAAVGAPTASDMESAHQFRASIPKTIEAKLTDPVGILDVVFGMLLSQDDAVRKKQVQMIGLPGAEMVYKSFHQTGQPVRLPYIELALQVLRLLPDVQQKVFMSQVRSLVRADNRVSPFEFAIELLLSKNLKSDENLPKKGGGDTLKDSMCVLSYLAYAGAGGNESAAGVAFRKAFVELEKTSPKAVLPWDMCGPDEARESLWRLTFAEPLQKKKIVAALTACVMADNVVKNEEWDVLRAFCQCLGCPTPLSQPNK